MVEALNLNSPPKNSRLKWQFVTTTELLMKERPFKCEELRVEHLVNASKTSYSHINSNHPSMAKKS